MNVFPWRPHGYRKSDTDTRSAAGALPPAGARAEGTEPSAGDAGGAARASVEIVAWRAWNLRGDSLISVSHDFTWWGPVVHADVLPTRGNASGIYALRQLDGVPFGEAWGEVALSGIVVEGENGYRAEVATIRSLYVGRKQHALEPDGYHAGHTFVEWPDAALCQALEARYKVDVVVCEPRLAHPNYVVSIPQYTPQQMQTLQQQYAQLYAVPQPVYSNTSNMIVGNRGGLGA